MIDTSLIQKYRQQGMTNNEILSTLSDNDESLKTRVQSHIFDNPALEDWEKEKASEYYLNTKLGKTKTVNEMDRLATASVKSNTDAFKQLKSSPLEYGIETIKNIPSSTGNLIGGVASAVASPLQTGKALFQAGVGGTVNTIESIASLAGVKNAEEIFDLSSENTAKAIGDFYVQRYGSVESAAQTLRDDPAGFLSDLGAVVGLTGGVISGGASLAGKMTGTVSRTSSQLGSVSKGINIAKSTGDSLIRAGYNMEPLVMAGKGVFFAGRQGIKGTSIVKDIARKALDPSRVVTKSLRINPTDIQYFTNLGKSELPGEFLIRKGILNSGDVESVSGRGVVFTGDTMVGRTKQAIMNDLERLSTKSRTTVDSLLNSVQETYNLVDEVPDAKILIDEISNIANKYDLREPKKIISEIMNKDRITLSDVNNLKRLAYDFFDTYKKSNIASDSYSAKQIIQYEQSLRKFIEDQANIKGIPDIAILNEDTMKAREILSAMEKADYANLSKGKNTISLVDGLVAMSTLGITGDYFLSIGALSARRIIESTLFKTTFAKYIDKLSSRDFNILRDSMKRGSHTQESKSIFQAVARKTSSEIKSKLDADFENTNGSIRRSQESSLGLEQEATLQKEIQSSPSTIQQASDNVQPTNVGVERLATKMDTELGNVMGKVDEMVPKGIKKISESSQWETDFGMLGKYKFEASKPVPVPDGGKLIKSEIITLSNSSLPRKSVQKSYGVKLNDKIKYRVSVVERKNGERYTIAEYAKSDTDGLNGLIKVNFEEMKTDLIENMPKLSKYLSDIFNKANQPTK